RKMTRGTSAPRRVMPIMRAFSSRLFRGYTSLLTCSRNATKSSSVSEYSISTRFTSRVALRRRRRLDLRLVLARHARHRRDLIAVLQAHDAHALRVAADGAHLRGVRAVDHAAGRDQHHVVVVAHRHHVHHRAVAVGGADVADALAAAPLLAVAHRR